MANKQRLLNLTLLAGLGACVVETDPTTSLAADETSSSTSAETSGAMNSGDGDGEPPGDGDGEPPGDGDGEPPGDGDGEPPGDGDGEPACSWEPNPQQNPEAECDPILQDCPAGEKCVGYPSMGGSWDNNKCVPVSGNQLPGQPCTMDSLASAIDNCDSTGQCFNTSLIDGQIQGTCLAFCGCDYQMPECQGNDLCSITNQGSLALCLEYCNPLLQDCPQGQGCYANYQTTVCVISAADLSVGEPCSYLNECATGNACTDVEACGGSCCTPFCNINGVGSECNALPGTTCTAVGNYAVCL